MAPCLPNSLEKVVASTWIPDASLESFWGAEVNLVIHLKFEMEAGEGVIDVFCAKVPRRPLEALELALVEALELK